MKKFCYGLLASVSSLAAGAPLFAQSGATVTPQAITIDDAVATNDLQATIVNSLQEWLVIGLGVGFTVLLVYVGWRLIKRFIR